jgi:hypothetical protein
VPSAAFIRWQIDRTLRLSEVDAHCAALLILVPPNPLFLDESLRGFVLHLSAHFQVSEWRNKAAHQGTQPLGEGVPTALTLPIVQGWRASCDGLATSLDEIMRDQLLRIMGVAPW